MPTLRGLLEMTIGRRMDHPLLTFLDPGTHQDSAPTLHLCDDSPFEMRQRGEVVQDANGKLKEDSRNPEDMEMRNMRNSCGFGTDC